MLNAYYLLGILGADIRRMPFLIDIILVSLVNFWQLFFLAFIPFILIKTMVMQRSFKQETLKKVLLVNAASNGLSILIGMPIAFGILLNTLGILLNVLVVSHYNWFLVLIIAGLLLFQYAYFVSVWIEQWVVTKFFGNRYERKTISQTVKLANKVSYALLFIVYVLFVITHGTYIAHELRSETTKTSEI